MKIVLIATAIKILSYLFLEIKFISSSKLSCVQGNVPTSLENLVLVFLSNLEICAIIGVYLFNTSVRFHCFPVSKPCLTEWFWPEIGNSLGGLIVLHNTRFSNATILVLEFCTAPFNCSFWSFLTSLQRIALVFHSFRNSLLCPGWQN